MKTIASTNSLVIGGGQAGLAAVHHLNRSSFPTMILDASWGPGGSWPRYYDSLTLFSPTRFSGLPGMPFPGDPERYPHRDEVVDYLTRYADRLGADIRYDHRVTALDPVEGGFHARGDSFEVHARKVIVASGSFDSPFIPAIRGLGSFVGSVLHASEYRSPGEFAGARVAVVGAGNSAVQIAVELAGVANVTVYSRRPIRWRRQRILGRDLHWWLARSGLDEARLSPWLLPATVPVIDDGRYRTAFRQGAVTWRPLFARIEDRELITTDGHRHEADVLLFATGYRAHMPFLTDTAALDSAGVPLHHGGVSTTVPGLGYVGLEHQRSFASATLRGVGPDARAIVDRLLAD